ncbi:hypothetical protein HaLaN_16451, partial [Haematococcus lacustris]
MVWSCVTDCMAMALRSPKGVGGYRPELSAHSHRRAPRMPALVFDEANHLVRPLENHPKPQPGDKEALVRVLRAGICSTVR